MATLQTILFTVMPRGVSLNPDTLPISVFVSPRLQGESLLGAYADWLDWTARRQEQGLRIAFECNGQRLTQDIPRSQLRPDLWRELFNRETLVQSHEFDDYADRFVASYPVRAALSSLKTTYQAAGIALALPNDQSDRQEESFNQLVLRNLVDGFQLDWSDEKGQQLREQQRILQRRAMSGFASLTARSFGNGLLPNQLGNDGLLKTGLVQPGSTDAKNLNQAVTERFGVFSHMPAGVPVTRESLNEGTVLDFHRVLTSLNTYPILQRQLGLVFDLELPREFVPLTPGLTPGTLSIVAVEGNWSADTTTIVPQTTTAYIYTGVETGDRFFFAAPRVLVTGNEPASILGLLILDPTRFGLAQVDVDGGMHKTIILAETAHRTTVQGFARPQHPEVFDPTATLASLRSGGISLYADNRALSLLGIFLQSKQFNDAIASSKSQPRPFFAEDLVRGYRIDIWDGVTGTWHSLHRRNGVYQIGTQEVKTEDEEGFVQLAATQAAPNADGKRDRDDLHLHEAMTRWAGWSLSADTPGKHLTCSPDPDQAVPSSAHPDPENEPITPFPVTTRYTVMPGSLPRLRFGGRYRFRVRAMDLAGNSLGLDDRVTDLLTPGLSLPAGEGTFPYLRFEPVAAPTLVLRDGQAITGAGSSLDRLVIRTFNTDSSQDGIAADLTASDRHIAPPRGTVEMGERHGMFDEATGRLNPSAAMWQLIDQRDRGQFTPVAIPSITIAGESQSFPIEPTERIETLPYLPDPLARGAVFRDLPGTPNGTIGRAEPGIGGVGEIAQVPLDAANPRPGSATLISFGGQNDWQQVAPFRLVLAEGNTAPVWDADGRSLTVFLPKGQTQVVPLSCYMNPEDLKLMGVWQWLREYIDYITTNQPEDDFYRNFASKDQIAHILQRALEGGHWMLTPPHLLTLVHAVQQPIGIPQFTRLNAQLDPAASQLQTQSETAPTATTELDVITAWRTPNATDTFLLGGLQIHAASTAKVDLRATWTDPVDDVSQPEPGEQTFATFVDEVPLNDLNEGILYSNDRPTNRPWRPVGYYDPDHDLLGFAPKGSALGNLSAGQAVYTDAMPRHQIGDTRHHLIKYTAIATSRYREYFPSKNDDGTDRDFTRPSAAIAVHVPASTRPLAPQIVYVLPTFGWQRETSTNLKRSVRIGGGLRIYLDRPWWSSGEGELLGVALWAGGAVDNQIREVWKPFITQWGQDPIWLSAPLPAMPGIGNFPDAVASETNLLLEEGLKSGTPRQVDVAGHRVEFDCHRKLWYCDLTIDPQTATYAPFVRLALVRYQPYALQEVKLSRVVLADFVQLTPERAATITADPYQPGQLRVVVSGPDPPRLSSTPATVVRVDLATVVTVTLQERDQTLQSDLGWRYVEIINPDRRSPKPEDPQNLALWSGSFRLPTAPNPNQYRLLITEQEVLSSDSDRAISQPNRQIYAEIIVLDQALLSLPAIVANRTTV